MPLGGHRPQTTQSANQVALRSHRGTQTRPSTRSRPRKATGAAAPRLRTSTARAKVCLLNKPYRNSSYVVCAAGRPTTARLVLTEQHLCSVCHGPHTIPVRGGHCSWPLWHNNKTEPGIPASTTNLKTRCRLPDNVGDTLPPGSRGIQKSRRSASASVVARPVTAGAPITARRGTSLRAGSKDVAVRSEVQLEVVFHLEVVRDQFFGTLWLRFHDESEES